MATELGNAIERERRLDEVIAAYVEAAESGAAPNRQEWLARFPDLAPELEAFFADEQQFNSLMAPLRVATPPPTIHRPTQPASGSTPAPASVVSAAQTSEVLNTSEVSPGRRFGDYELLEEIAQGGMGIVYKARQVSLNRVVALKMIRNGQLALREEVERFRLEAEAAANLDHPHIVPIYEIGEYDGHHYFSMRLIEGGNLIQRLGEFRLPVLAARTRKDASGRVWSRADLHQRKARMVKLLAAVARAVEYAHQHGLLHRDLKPGNILVDGAGAPHVTDFGLAKRVAGLKSSASGFAPAGQPAPGENGDHSLTQPGIAVGTPNYMAPEQAAGPKTALTTAADVYSLGAILYHLLTGRPPFRAETPLETLVEVLEREPERPRTLSACVDRDLETICLKCLDKDPVKRYPRAAALADDLERYLAGEPIEARPVGNFERFRRWCRRNPSLALVSILAAVSAVAAVVVLGLLLFNESRHNTELLVEKQETEKALRMARRQSIRARKATQQVLTEQSETKKALITARLNAREAKTQRQLAETRFHQAHGVIGDLCLGLSGRQLDNFPGLQPLRQQMLEKGLKYYEDVLRQKGDNPAIQQELASVHFHIAGITAVIGSPHKALAAYERAVAIDQKLLLTDPNNVSVQADLARAYLNMALVRDALGKPQEAMETQRRAHDSFARLTREHPGDPQMQSSLAASCTNLGIAYRARGEVATALEYFRKALELQQDLVRRYPRSVQFQGELAIGLVNVGVLHGVFGQGQEALACYEEARTIQEKLVKDKAASNRMETQRDLALNYRRIGNRLYNLGQHARGLAVVRQGHTLAEQLAATNPSVTEFQMLLAASHREIGHLLRNNREPEAAYKSYQQAGVILEKLVRRHAGVWPIKNELATTYYHGGALKADRGQKKLGHRLLRSAFRLQQTVVRANPDNLHYRVDLASFAHRLGQALGEEGRPDAALAAYRAAAEHQSVAVDKAPLADQYGTALARYYGSLADAQRQGARPDDAWRTLRLAHTLIKHLAELDPRDARFQGALANSYKRLARFQWLEGKLDLAFHLYQQARSVLDRLTYVHPTSAHFPSELALTCFDLAMVAKGRSRGDQVLYYYGKAQRLLEARVAADPYNLHYRTNLSATLNNLGLALAEIGRYDDGVKLLRQAVEHLKVAVKRNPWEDYHRSSLSRNYASLANILRRAGRPAEAVAVTRERHKLAAGKPVELYLAGRDFALAAAVVGKDKARLTPAERVERQGYCDEAVEALRQALACGFKGREQIRKDPDLAVLRDRASFKKLITGTNR